MPKIHYSYQCAQSIKLKLSWWSWYISTFVLLNHCTPKQSVWLCLATHTTPNSTFLFLYFSSHSFYYYQYICQQVGYGKVRKHSIKKRLRSQPDSDNNQQAQIQAYQTLRQTSIILEFIGAVNSQSYRSITGRQATAMPEQKIAFRSVIGCSSIVSRKHMQKDH